MEWRASLEEGAIASIDPRLLDSGPQLRRCRRRVTARFLSANPSIARFREQWQQQQRSQFLAADTVGVAAFFFLADRPIDRATAAPTEITWRVALIDAPSKCHSHNLRFAAAVLPPLPSRCWMELAPMLLRPFPCSRSCERASARNTFQCQSAEMLTKKERKNLSAFGVATTMCNARPLHDSV